MVMETGIERTENFHFHNWIFFLNRHQKRLLLRNPTVRVIIPQIPFVDRPIARIVCECGLKHFIGFFVHGVDTGLKLSWWPHRRLLLLLLLRLRRSRLRFASFGFFLIFGPSPIARFVKKEITKPVLFFFIQRRFLMAGEWFPIIPV